MKISSKISTLPYLTKRPWPIYVQCLLQKGDDDMWIHVDAAYAGASFLCPEYRHFMKGIEVYGTEFGFKYIKRRSNYLQSIASKQITTIPESPETP